MSEGVDFSAGDSLSVDLSNVEDSSFEVMPKGVYNAVITEVEFTHSQNSGNPMWSLQYEVEDGDFAGRKLFSHMVWVGKGLPITKRHITRIAPELLEGPFNPADDEVIATLEGRRVRLKVNIRKYEGEDRNNVQDVLAAADEGGFI